MGRGVVRLRALIPPDPELEAGDLTARVVLYRGRKLLGRSRAVRRNGTISIMLNRAGRRSLRRGMRVELRQDVDDTYLAARTR